MMIIPVFKSINIEPDDALQSGRKGEVNRRGKEQGLVIGIGNTYTR
jgi:hypothetical protein